MKTALQKAFSRLEELHPELFNVYSPGGRDFINEFHKFLELEKEQIINAHGSKLRKSKGVTNYEYWYHGEDYFNDTFKNTKDD